MAGYWKALSAAVGLAAFIGFTGSAQALVCKDLGSGVACDVSNVSTGAGQTYSIPNHGDQFAGLLNFTVTNWGGTGQSQTIAMICDDFNHEVSVGNINPPYEYYVESADTYLAPLGTNVIHEIAGLAFFALATGDSVDAGDAQMAIWDLMAGGHTSQFDLNAHITALEGLALNFYSQMVQQGWTYAEFESPTGNCVAGQFTFQDACGVQGQLVLLGGRTKIIVLPEPGTLGLFGMALLALGGLGWMRSRRGFGIG